MSDHDTSPGLDDAFAAFRSGGPLVVPAGAWAARKVARRRRTNRLVATGVTAAVLVAVPVLANAGGDPDPPVPPAQTVSPSPTAPTTTVPATPTPSATSPSAEPPPDGRIHAKTLANATLDLPAWPGNLADECPSGRVRFSDGRAQRSASAELRASIVQVVHADLDRDGTQETAALLDCSGLEMGEARVLAFDRDPAGAIITMGVVIGETGDIGGIRRIRGEDRSVAAEVTDRSGDGTPDSLAQRQWRIYSRSGGRFVQTGGPDAFPPNPRVTDLSVTGSELRLAPDGDRTTGTLRLTVRNAGPQPAAAPRVQVDVPKGFEVRPLPSTCTRFVSSQRVSYRCELKALPVGGGATFELPISVVRSQVGTGVVGEYSAKVWWSRTAEDVPYPEPTGATKDNSTSGDIVVTG
ncbi:hypothetical protein [Micromonospora sp. NPDC023644]|uniref:hypothetical protein n=1 Tax=Micromonospora sp. NPDC023644 TaxID=3154321 RepID=UPI0033C6134F